MRHIVLDTETTGLSPLQGDRIIEIGAIDIINRKVSKNFYQQYINPECDVSAEAEKIHGVSTIFLQDKPVFAEAVNEFMEFISGAELIIHNATFDVNFINHELSLLQDNKWGKLENHCTITDSLKMAQKQYPSQRNSLDALCKRLNIDNSNRELHGALKDCKILAKVYLAMTGGQKTLFKQNNDILKTNSYEVKEESYKHLIPVIQPSDEELLAHKNYMEVLSKKVSRGIDW